jgi:biotin transport system substrate-specific component
MTTRDLVLVALFAAIIVALGLIPPVNLGFIPVPVHAQSLGVMLAGVVLGAKRGTLAIALFMLLAAIGLPVLAGARGGLGVFMAPPSGYLYGYLPAAFVTGLICERFVSARQTGLVQGSYFFVAAVVGGVLACHLCGVLWLAFVSGLGLEAAFKVTLAFIPGDVLKALIAAFAGRAVMVGYPLLPQRA